MNSKDLPGNDAVSVRLGPFALYPSERALYAAGRPVELGARAFDLLVVLVEHQGRLASKATLLERVWPRLVVDENNLPAQIAALRRVLGAGAIRTVAGFGYRLELPILPGKPASLPDGAAVTPPVEAPQAQYPQRLNPPSLAFPSRLAPMVGRDADVTRLQEALNRSGIVTVVGSGGIGKTRIAQEILARELQGAAPAAWVSLQPLDDLQQVPSAIALALGVSLPEGLPGFVSLGAIVKDSPLLLVLDGAEHLGEALAAPLSELVMRARGLRALVTSQVPLGIPGETVYRLEALAVPDGAVAPHTAQGFGAVELFVQRAAAADRRFELTASNVPFAIDICRRLDGNPLAIELAAARLPALGIQVLLERLDDRFRLLKSQRRAADPRHDALHAAFDWSYRFLSPKEQRVFNRLGTFAGSFSLLVAARSVADQALDEAEAIDLIGRLVDRSLVAALPTDPPRYVLSETGRYYALDRLAEAGDVDSAQAAQARSLLALLDTAFVEYWSIDEAIWLHRYEPEIGNVRAALEWSLGQDRELAVSLYGSSWPLFVEADIQSQARGRYDELLKRLSDSLPRSRTARFWEAVATYDSSRQCDRARYAAELAAGMFEAAGDLQSRYYALLKLAFNCRSDDGAAEQAVEAARAILDPAWPPRLLAQGAITEGALQMSAGEFLEARLAYRRAVRFALTVSERQALEATVSIVELDIACGDVASALQLGRPLQLSLRHSGRRETLFDVLVLTFSALLLDGALAEARETGAELNSLAQRLDTGKLYTALDAMAYLACLDGRFDAAARIALRADLAHQAHGQHRRRPVQELLRLNVVRQLQKRPPAQVRPDARDGLDEAAACALGLGLRD